ncbi:MAG: hypothetical protein HY084_04860 [Gemmatimonadetes bacterium]|nr:hypothetical protein [Gemmatimonadota bacterium]
MSPHRLGIAALLLALAAIPAQAQRADNPHGPNVGACSTCHRADGWKPAAISPSFRHAERTFPLEGAHARTACGSCHTSLVFSKAATNCASCHSDVHKGEFGTTCDRCHTARSFVDPSRMARAHELTLFPLRGAHVAVPCESCHTPTAAGQAQYRGRPTTCIGCHLTTFRATKAPDHQGAGFSQDCASCHDVSSWLTAKYDHSVTRFPLAGAHRAVSCAGCHGDGVFKGKPMLCNACHAADYAASKNPPHAASGFPTDCAACHTVQAWKGATFDHSATQFPLTGAHLTTLCTSCHGDNVFKGKPTACQSCHQKDFAASLRPPHSQLGFTSACAACHTTVAWQGAPYDHSVTRFPLTGAHKTATCNDCHSAGVYRGRPSACASCHQADYDKSVNPPHAAQGFPVACEACHGTTSWKGAVFNHDATLFPLTGMHKTLVCLSCHTDGVYKGRSTACVSCHQKDYNASLRPPHSQLGLSTACAACHTTSAWLGGSFDHSVTQFPLTGAHKTVACSGCHGDGVYKGKSTVCVSCHLKDYNASLRPPHSALGFSTACASCHGTVAWAGGSFDHSTTAFPLTGAHRAAMCNDCHADGVYKGKSTACYSCHQSNYAATKNPPHNTTSFPTASCASCHSTTAWSPATFNHATTRFPLTGAHVTTPCAGCHGDGVYSGKTMVCVGCHQANYDATTNPNHKTVAFPTTCASCHTTTTWLGATFNHDASFFPIYSGKHKGRWSQCSDCHTVPTNYSLFLCTNCHLKPDMDNAHKGRSGYKYDSPTCYSCHPRGTTP